MKKGIEVVNLKDYPEHVGTVVEWLFSEWGNNNFKYWDSWVRYSLQDNQVPMTLIALVDGELAGTISLWNCDLQSRQDLWPWVGGLYVDEKFRGREHYNQKLGLLLQKNAFEQLKRMGYKQAYAFTEKDPNYYLRNGWDCMGEIPDESDKMVTLMRKKI